MPSLALQSNVLEAVHWMICQITDSGDTYSRKKLSCCYEVARRSMSLEIMLSHSRSLKFIRNYTAELGISFYYNKVSILYFVQTTF